MFPSQMVLKIVLNLLSPSNGTPENYIPSSIPLYPCFPRKWYALKLFPPQVVHFIHVSLANGMP